MRLSTQTVLRRLGGGEPIGDVCAAAGVTRQEFDAWWHAEAASRLPDPRAERRVAVAAAVEIRRDRWGVPHIFAAGEDDLLFGLGFAMAQDRLWQLDYFRRRAWGRLAEVLGPEAIGQDVLVRTVGLNRIAARQAEQLAPDTERLLEAFSAGINAVIEESRRAWPLEFDLLGYEPEPWRVGDCLAIWVHKRWYSSGRIPVIALPELARRRLGDDALFAAFLTAEADDESILPPGSYPAGQTGAGAVGTTVGDPEEGIGSNNWVVAGRLCETGRPLLASDPHTPFSSLNERFEFHLCGGGFNTAGATLLGIPAVIFGRNARVAWGLTNNICSQRDLYLERTSSDQPGHFLFDGRWEPARELVETIAVRGGDAVRLPVRFSRNGPIVNALLPDPARGGDPVSLRWMGATLSDEVSCLLAANRAESSAAFREALRAWRTPSWSFVFADVDGHIGYQAVGGLPIREGVERGYRPGWESDHQWQGIIPFNALPALADPPRGWVASANNRTAPDDFPYPLGGTWSSSHRARRIRQLIEGQGVFHGSQGRERPPPEFVGMHQDQVSLRALEALPPLLAVLDGAAGRAAEARALLAAWDGRMGTELAAAAIFAAFSRHWSARVAAERFGPQEAELFTGAVGGLAIELLSEDRHGWFRAPAERPAAIRGAMDSALEELAGRLGTDMDSWAWGRLHTLTLHHPLSGRGDLGALLDRGPVAVGGSAVTLCNTGFDAPYDAGFEIVSGANFRIIADLAMDPPGLWAVSAAGQSGQPGSPHYCDQTGAWLAGRYHLLTLTTAAAQVEAESGFVLRPQPARGTPGR